MVLNEIHRLLTPHGTLIASVPNQAHLNSRFSFFLLGQIHRADSVINHIGERPYDENRKLIIKSGFHVDNCIGITLTIPILYKFIARFPARLRWLHDLMEPFAIPSLSLLNVFFCHARQ